MVILIRLIRNSIFGTKLGMDTSEEIKKLVQEGLEIEKKVHNYVEEFQLSQKDLREGEIDFDYILKEIENELK